MGTHPIFESDFDCLTDEKMSFVCGIEDPCIAAWSPPTAIPAYLATGTFDGGVYGGGVQATLDLNVIKADQLVKVISTPLITPLSSLAWAPTTQSDPLGVLVGGHQDGKMLVYSPSALLSDAADSAVLHTTERHTGNVTTIDVNPFQSNLVASGAGSSEIFIWDLNAPGKPMTPGQKIQPLSPITACAWNAKVQHILGTLIGLPSGTQAVIWDLRKNEPIIKIQDRSAKITHSALSWNPLEPTQFALGCEDDNRPVIQLWDVRQAQQPYQIIEGHQKGITNVEWSRADPRLLMSSGRDGSVLIFDVKSGTKVGECPRQPGAVVKSVFSPRHPQLVAVSSESGTSVYDICGVPSAPKMQTQKQAAALDDAFGAASGSLPVQNEAEEPAPEPIKMAPVWLGRKSGASWGFGGRLVQWDATGKELKLSQVRTEAEVVNQSKELIDSLAQNVAAFCEVKKEKAIDGDGTVWKFIHARTQDNARQAFFELLKTKPPLTPTTPTTPIPPVVEEEEVISRPGSGEPPKEASEASSFNMVDKADDNQPDSQLAGLMSGGGDDDFPDLTAQTDQLDLAPAPPVVEEQAKSPEPMVLPPQDISPIAMPTTELDAALADALIGADFAAAVAKCLESARFAEALIIARLGGDELLATTIDQYQALKMNPVSDMISIINKKDWAGLIGRIVLHDWKFAMGTILTYCDDSQLYTLSEQLGDRLESTGQFGLEAVICYVVAGCIDKLLVNIEKYQICQGAPLGGASYLQEMVEKVLILRATPAAQLGARGLGVLREYALLLSSQGQFKDALGFLSEGSNEADSELIDRLKTNTGEKPQKQQAVVKQQQQQQQQQQSTSGRLRRNRQTYAQPTSHFQPPAPAPAPTQTQFQSAPPANNFQPMQQQAPTLQPAPLGQFQPAPAPPTPAPAQHFQPMSTPAPPVTAMAPPMNTFQPAAPQPQQPAPPMGALSMGGPITSQPMAPPPMGQPMGQMAPPPSAYGQPSSQANYGYQADISHIPTGPSLERREMTPGWNDPRNAACYTEKPLDDSMRLRRSKKKPSQIIPEDMGTGFVPAPAPQPNQMGGQMAMGGQ